MEREVASVSFSLSFWHLLPLEAPLIARTNWALENESRFSARFLSATSRAPWVPLKFPSSSRVSSLEEFIVKSRYSILGKDRVRDRTRRLAHHHPRIPMNPDKSEKLNKFDESIGSRDTT